MDKSLNVKIETIAKKIKSHHDDLIIDTFLSFMATTNVFERYLRTQIKEKDTSRIGYTILNALILFGGSLSPTEIAKVMYLTKDSVSKAIFTLERHGFVKTGSHENDRRRRKVEITAMGLKIAEKGNLSKRESVARTALSILDEGEIKQLNRIVKKLREHTLAILRKRS
jgi:DNA-binding MarR family transcriptional regulator